jgi:hypothetical protein
MHTRKALMLILAALALLAAACGDTARTTAQNGPSLTISSPRTGSITQGNVVRLDLEATGIDIVKADGDTSGKTGHYHVFIDREPVAAGALIERAAGIVHSADDPVVLTGLSVGYHTFTVVLGDGGHRRIGNASARTQVEVKGPSVDATAPATSAAGQPLSVDVTVQGVTLIAADGDVSGKTGHLHVFVDRDPTTAGQAIPKEAGIIHTAATPITVEGLTTGEHTIWVVLGDGVHVPFAPMVADKLTVTVT